MNKLEELFALGIKIRVWGHEIYKGKWYVEIISKLDGVELKVEETGLDLQFTIDTAYDKFMAHAPRAMKTPVLEAIKPGAVTYLNDEMPF